jgi:hypothetical protein
MALMRSFSQILILPLLHKNMNKFFGMSHPNAYICYKVIKDKMIALTRKGKLTCWNIVTGKKLTTVELEGHNYIKYSIISEEKNGAVLL